MESEVRELLTEELKDAFSAEKQALRCMQKALKSATAPALKEGIQLHIEQTQTQIERLEQAMEKMDMKPGRKVCEAMRGLVEEAQHEIPREIGASACYGALGPVKRAATESNFFAISKA